jgi:hypothetical protein
MTPVIPHGLTQEHYLQSYALQSQPKKLPEPNGVNSVPSKVMMMMMTMMMISSMTNYPSNISTLLMKVMTPFLIVPTTIITSMTTCHQISFAKMKKWIPHLKRKVAGSDKETDSMSEREGGSDGETNSTSESED